MKLLNLSVFLFIIFAPNFLYLNPVTLQNLLMASPKHDLRPNLSTYESGFGRYFCVENCGYSNPLSNPLSVIINRTILRGRS